MTSKYSNLIKPNQCKTYQFHFHTDLFFNQRDNSYLIYKYKFYCSFIQVMYKRGSTMPPPPLPFQQKLFKAPVQPFSHSSSSLVTQLMMTRSLFVSTDSFTSCHHALLPSIVVAYCCQSEYQSYKQGFKRVTQITNLKISIENDKEDSAAILNSNVVIIFLPEEIQKATKNCMSNS